jgi:hypothetical protein
MNLDGSDVAPVTGSISTGPAEGGAPDWGRADRPRKPGAERKPPPGGSLLTVTAPGLLREVGPHHLRRYVDVGRDRPKTTPATNAERTPTRRPQPAAGGDGRSSPRRRSSHPLSCCSSCAMGRDSSSGQGHDRGPNPHRPGSASHTERTPPRPPRPPAPHRPATPDAPHRNRETHASSSPTKPATPTGWRSSGSTGAEHECRLST